MNRQLLILIIAFSAFKVHAQWSKDTLVLEFSPAFVEATGRINWATQARATYVFGKMKFFELGAVHNHSFSNQPPAYYKEKLSPNPYQQNSYSAAYFGLILVRDGFRSTSRPVLETYNIRPYELKLDVGLFHPNYQAFRTDYYTYDSTATGERQSISNIKVLSLSAGLTYSFYVYKRQLLGYRWLRKYQFSFGFLHGLTYDLDGFTRIDGQNPSTEPPKIYGFRRDGYYARFNFQQGIGKRMFVGLEAFFYRTPLVQYKPQSVYYVPRGGELESPFKPYLGLIVGWRF